MKNLSVVFKYAFAIGLLAYLLNKGFLNLNLVKEVLTISNVAIFFSLSLVANVVMATRLHLLLSVNKIHIQFKNILKLHFIGIFFNNALPGSVSGDVVKGYYLFKGHPENKTRSFFALIEDRVIGVYTMLTMSVVSIFFFKEKIFQISELKIVSQTLLVIFGLVTLFGAGFVFSKKAQYQIKKINYKPIQILISQVQTLRENYKKILACFLCSLVSQIIAIYMLYIAGNSVSSEYGFAIYFLIGTIGFMLTAIPISPGGIGLGQAVFHFLFLKYFGQGSDVGTTAITVLQFFNLLWGIVGVVLYTQFKKIDSESAKVHPA